jgi:hypothetical protein
MARNGCTKVVIVSGHGGNTNLIQFFAQTHLETPKDWMLYAIMNDAQGRDAQKLAPPSKPGADGHTAYSCFTASNVVLPNWPKELAPNTWSLNREMPGYVSCFTSRSSAAAPDSGCQNGLP